MAALAAAELVVLVAPAAYIRACRLLAYIRLAPAVAYIIVVYTIVVCTAV